jgi:hypothetical protein
VNVLQRALDTLVGRVDTPASIVLIDVMQANIDRMQGFAAQHNLDVRPHVKTHKCVEIGRRQVEAGAVGITAGNVGEAEVFAAAGSTTSSSPTRSGPRELRGRGSAGSPRPPGFGSAWTSSRRSMPSPTRWVMKRTGTRSWSRSTVAPVDLERRQRWRGDLALAARKLGLVPVASSRTQVIPAPVGTLPSAPRRTSTPGSPPRCAASPTWGSPQRWSAPAPHPPSSSPPAA